MISHSFLGRSLCTIIDCRFHMLLSYTVGAHDAADERGEFNENPRCHCGFIERENKLNVVFSCKRKVCK